MKTVIENLTQKKIALSSCFCSLNEIELNYLKHFIEDSLSKISLGV